MPKPSQTPEKSGQSYQIPRDADGSVWYYSHVIHRSQGEESSVGLKKLSTLLGQRMSVLGRHNSLTLLAASLLLVPGLCFGANTVLIINGASVTSEPGTTSDITTNLSAIATAAGGTVTVSDGIPASVSGFSQVWDIRFSNTSPLSAADITKYVAYLQSGGALFAMGENGGFTTRNNSVIALVAAAGGGSLTFTTSLSSTQTVLAPFTGPNAVSSFTYSAPGGVIGLPSPGTGAFATVDNASHNGSAIWWTGGALSAAPSGTLAVVFDVNFMEAGAGVDSVNFLKNLAGQFAIISSGDGTTPTPAGAPAMSDLGLILLGLLLVVLAARSLRTAPALR